MSRLRFERKRAGLALMREGKATPLGYVRGDKLLMKRGDEYEEFSAEDFERIARELRAMATESSNRRLHKIKMPVITSAP